MDTGSPIRFASFCILCVLLVGACTSSGQQSPPAKTTTPTPEAFSNVQAGAGVTETRATTPTRESTTTHTPTETDVGASMETALVVQVLDGDTIEVVIDGASFRLRYIGIDSPEDGQPFSVEAGEVNRQLVEGKKVVLEKDVSETDRYERLLRYVFLLDGTFVNAELVRLGMARAAAYEPDTRYQQFFEQAQAQAQAQGAGIWGQPDETATPPAVEGGFFIDPACSQFDAPGNDNENMLEEYICVSNQSASAFDLSGWAIRDEYGWQYTFPAFILGAGTNVRIRTGCGADTAQDLHWCREETAIWNNGGDCAYLIDASGETVNQYCY